MYKQDSVRQVLEDYKITVTGKKIERRHRPISYCSWTVNDLDPYNHQIEEELIQVLKIEVQEAEFTKIADTLCEIRDLMRDPETAKLLMEARFINRLKGNR